jgi:hypothetical protein
MSSFKPSEYLSIIFQKTMALLAAAKGNPNLHTLVNVKSIVYAFQIAKWTSTMRGRPPVVLRFRTDGEFPAYQSRE